MRVDLPIKGGEIFQRKIYVLTCFDLTHPKSKDNNLQDPNYPLVNNIAMENDHL